MDNHDVARLVNKLNDRGHLKPVYTLAYTLPGVPSVYYGSEWGIEGRKEYGDAALRPAISLEKIEQDPPVPGLCEFIAWLARMRKEHPALQEGRYRELMLTNRQYAFARILGEQAVITAVNNDPDPAEVWIRLPLDGKTITDLADERTIAAEGGQLHITLDGNSGRLFALE